MHIIGTLNLIAIKFYIVYQYGYECDDEAPEKSSSIRPGVVTPGRSRGGRTLTSIVTNDRSSTCKSSIMNDWKFVQLTSPPLDKLFKSTPPSKQDKNNKAKLETIMII
jgi:hypothetical protein